MMTVKIINRIRGGELDGSMPYHAEVLEHLCDGDYATLTGLRRAWILEIYPRTESEAITCVHGNTIWLGHECGECEG